MIRALSADVGLEDDDEVVEFCAGLGAFSAALLGKIKRLYLVEIDRRFIPVLQALADTHTDKKRTQVHVARADALRFDLRGLAASDRLRVLGNLAYNISTPLLLRCLAQIRCIRDIHFLLQTEVAQRICAPRGGSDYGRLAVVLQTWFDVGIVRRVAPDCFLPKPKVNSSFVRLAVRPKPYLAIDHVRDYRSFIERAFKMRRKSLVNNLNRHYPQLRSGDLSHCEIAPLTRPEQVSLSQFAALFTRLHSP